MRGNLTTAVGQLIRPAVLCCAALRCAVLSQHVHCVGWHTCVNMCVSLHVERGKGGEWMFCAGVAESVVLHQGPATTTEKLLIWHAALCYGGEGGVCPKGLRARAHRWGGI